MVERKIISVKIDQLRPNSWNPQTQDEATFNALCQNIQESGFLEPILVWGPHKDETGEYYIIISGEHRYEAAKLLGFTELPCVIAEDFDEDMAKFQTIRMNALKGKIDPVKFSKLVREMQEKYSLDELPALFGITDQKVFDKLFLDMKKALPKEMREKLQKAKSEVKNVDDLSRILNELFTKYGSTIDYSYMLFTFGGRTHYWIMASHDLIKMMDRMAEVCSQEGVNINFLFEEAMKVGFNEETIARAVKRAQDARAEEDPPFEEVEE